MLNLIQFVTLFLVLFPKWGEGATAFQNLPLPIYNVGSLPRMLVKGTIVNKNFPTLRGTISMNERQHLTWEEHLKRTAHLLSSLNSICNSPCLFRHQINKIESGCPLSVSDLKVIARVFFDYDFEVPFFSLNCSVNINVKTCPQHLCLFVSSENCYSLDDLLLSNLKGRLNAIRRNFSISLFHQRQTLFFYCETPCCHVVHQVTALVIMKNIDNTFSAWYFDPSDRGVSSFKQLSIFIQEIFNTNLIVQFCFQQDRGMLDNLSGVFVLANVKAFFNNIPPHYPDQNMSNENFLIFKAQLNNFLVWKTVKILRQKLIFNLRVFSHLFSREREAALVTYLGRGGSLLRSDFLIIKDLVNQEQDKFLFLFNLLNSSHPTHCFIKSAKGAVEFCFFLKNNIQTMVGKDFIPLSSDSLESFLVLITDLKSKLFWLNNVVGGNISTLISPSWPSSSQLIFNDIDDPTISFNPKKIKNVNSNQSKSRFVLSGIWEQDFPIVKWFLDFDSWTTASFQEQGVNLFPRLNYLTDFSFFIRKIMNDWTRSSFLFSKSFSPHRMLSVGEELILAKLICNFSPDKIFITSGSIRDCFIEVVCPRSGDAGNGTSCGYRHSRNPSVNFKATNCLLVGSDGCSNDSTEIELIFMREVTNRLIAYKNAIENNPRETRPLVIIGYCYSACCQAIHQSWTLVVSLSIRQAFYFDPSGKRQFATSLATSIQQYFPGIILNSFKNNGPQQPHGSLDFSGVLAICGAKAIVDYHLSYPVNYLGYFLYASLPNCSNSEHSRSNDYWVQLSFKNRLVVTALKRLFSHLFFEISIYTKRFNSLRRRFPQETTWGVEEIGWLTNFVRQIELPYRRIFLSNSTQTIIQHNHDFEDLFNHSLNFLRSRPPQVFLYQ